MCTQDGYVKLATEAGLRVFAEPKDISKDVAKTWWAALLNVAGMNNC
jgi:tocopherol O-methyltransferase